MFDTKNLVKKISDKFSDDNNEPVQGDLFTERIKNWPFESESSIEHETKLNTDDVSSVERFINAETGVFDLDELERQANMKNIASNLIEVGNEVKQPSLGEASIDEVERNFNLCHKIIEELNETLHNAEKYGKEFDVLDYIESLKSIYSIKFKSLYNSIQNMKK